MNCVNAWSSIIDIFRSRLGVWKAKSLLIVGRITLIKFVLSFLGNYIVSVFPNSLTLIHSLESLRARFF